MTTAPAIRAPLRYRDQLVPWVVLTGKQPEAGKRYTLMTIEGLEIARAATEAWQRTLAQKPQPVWQRVKVAK